MKVKLSGRLTIMENMAKVTALPSRGGAERITGNSTGVDGDEDLI